MAESEEGGAAEESKPSLMLPLLLTALFSIAISVGLSMLLLGGDDGTAQSPSGKKQKQVAEEEIVLGEEESYLPLDKFTINLEGKGDHVMLVELQVVSRDVAALEALQKHMPVVRNDLNLLFSGQRYRKVLTTEGKEALREKTLRAIQKILRKKIRRKGVDAVFFTSFVTQ